MTLGTSSLSWVGGGIEVLSDGSDATYLKCTNLDQVAFQGVTITFPSFGVAADKWIDWKLEARYECVSGDRQGVPGVVLDVFDTTIPTDYYAGPLQDVSGYWAVSGDPVDPAPNPLDGWVYEPGTTTDMVGDFGFGHTGFGTVDFRVYQLSLFAVVEDPPVDPVVGTLKIWTGEEWVIA
jgi:hypothetical protein